jgi:hypothetical protein
MENARVLLSTGEILWVDPRGFESISRAFAAGNAAGRYFKVMVAENEAAPPSIEMHLNVDQIVSVRKPSSAARPAAR